MEHEMKMTFDTNKWLMIAVVTFTSSLWIVSANNVFSEERPNILFIISDDQGYGDFGFMGNPVLRTPRLDQLAAESAVFENYTTGVACSPGRAMLFSGRNYLSTGVWGVGARFGLRRDETLLPIFFRESGYATFYVGKADCIAPHRMSPHFAGWQEALFVGGYQHRDARLYHAPLAPLHSTKPVDIQGWTSEYMTGRGVQFIRKKKGSAWLLTMAYIIPHLPWKPVDERFAPYYREKGCSENIAACFSHIEQMDACVGQLLDALKETGQDRYTLVIFVSDNGQTGLSHKSKRVTDGRHEHPDWTLRNVAGLRGSKSTAWENGTRVPLLVRMPGTIPPGMREQFATAEDLLPTLLDVAGIPADRVPHKPFSGVSLRAALMDKQGEVAHREVFRITNWHPGNSLTGKTGYIPDPGAMKLEDYHAVLRGPQHKLEIYPDGKVELHDIIRDKQERHDISKEHPEVTRRMLTECRRQFRALIDDGAFRFSTIYIGDPRSKNRRGTYFDSAARIQSHTGNISVIPKLTGFAREGDSVTYTIESAAAGTYAISLTGEFADAAPLRVEVAGTVLPQQKLNENELTFGTVNLPKGQFSLRLVAGKPTGKARPASVDDILFAARSLTASKPLGLRRGPNATVLLERETISTKLKQMITP